MAALGASVTIPAAAERTSFWEIFGNSVQELKAKLLEPVGDPISPPLPRLKPDLKAPDSAVNAVEDEVSAQKRDLNTAFSAQCGLATIHGKPAKDGESIVYRVSFAEGMVDEMAGKGCAQFYQGCNTCSVQYLGCSPAERMACKDLECLEKTCERAVRCSAKSCTAEGPVDGKPPSCTSRFARTSCLRTHFE